MENSSSWMMVCNFPSSLSPDGGKAQQMGILGHPSIYRHLCILNTGLVFVKYFLLRIKGEQKTMEAKVNPYLGF